jgi:hypothetical protein
MEISNKRYELPNSSPGVLLFGVGAGHLYQDSAALEVVDSLVRWWMRHERWHFSCGCLLVVWIYYGSVGKLGGH